MPGDGVIGLAHGDGDDAGRLPVMRRFAEHSGKGDKALVDHGEIAVEKHLHAAVHEAPVDVRLVDDEAAPRRDHRPRHDDEDPVPFPGEVFGEGAARNVGIVVEDHHRREHPRAGKNVVGGADKIAVLSLDRPSVGAPHSVGPPPRSGGQDDVAGAPLVDLVGAEPAVAVDLDVRHGRDLPDPPVPHPRPLGKSRQARHAAPQFVRRLGKGHLVAPAVLAASSPAGPAPTTRTREALPRGGTVPGCHPRRHSSDMAGFRVQRMGTDIMLEARHTFQPMHSRMSSRRPSSIFLGRKGSAIEGLAAPMKSTTPRLTIAAIVSRLVNRQTPTTGLLVRVLTNATEASCQPSPRKREVCMSFALPTLTSRRSGTSARVSTTTRHCSSPRTAGAPFFLDAEAQGDGAAAGGLVHHRLAGLAQQVQAVVEAAAVFVRAPVDPRRQEVREHRDAVTGIDVDEIVAGLEGASDALPVPQADVAEVLGAAWASGTAPWAGCGSRRCAR